MSLVSNEQCASYLERELNYKIAESKWNGSLEVQLKMVKIFKLKYCKSSWCQVNQVACLVVEVFVMKEILVILVVLVREYLSPKWLGASFINFSASTLSPTVTNINVF